MFFVYVVPNVYTLTHRHPNTTTYSNTHASRFLFIRNTFNIYHISLLAAIMKYEV